MEEKKIGSVSSADDGIVCVGTPCAKGVIVFGDNHNRQYDSRDVDKSQLRINAFCRSLRTVL